MKGTEPQIFDCCFCRKIDTVTKQTVPLLFDQMQLAYSYACHDECLYRHYPTLRLAKHVKKKTGDDYVDMLRTFFTQSIDDRKCCYCSLAFKGRNYFIMHCYVTHGKEIVDLVHCSCIKKLLCN